MTKSTKSPQRRNKPQKPYDGFPLFPHATGRWAKKIRQNLHYFGKVADDPDGKQALEKLNREWPYLKDGRTPPAIDTEDGCTLRVLCNAFLTSKKNKLDSGELSARSFRDYFITCERLIEHLGRDRRVDDLRPDDFERMRKGMSKRCGVVTLKNEINRCRVVFKFASDNRLIDRAVHYGQSFNKPSAKMLRESRNEAGPRLFESDELHRILGTADPIMRAMVLIGLNCGFGNTDVSLLPQ